MTNCYKMYNDFKYWFKFNARTSEFTFYDKEDPEFKYIVNTANANEYHDMLAEFEEFKRRPEYAVYRFMISSSSISYKDELDPRKLDLYISDYEDILKGVCYIRAKQNNPDKDPDSCDMHVSRMINWLRTSDFYMAPASSYYHEAYDGGLIYHTFRVMSNICSLINVPKFASVDPVSALLVAMIHDWCKICRYESYEKNVKNETTGVWEKVKAFRRKDPIVPLGHGETSMYYAMKYIRLSLGEALAVRWHMGEYKCEYTEQNELETANMNYPLVYMLQFADRLACTAY